jgi:hypothetical protein
MPMMTVIAILLGLAFQAAKERIEYVPFCELVQQPERYDQKSVLTSGVLQAGPEFAAFSDPACPASSERDVSTLPVPIRARVQDSTGWKRMDQVLDRDKRAFVVIRGVFDAYNRYDGPLPADARLQEVLKKGNSRFGHLNFARFRLRIESVEFVAAVN